MSSNKETFWAKVMFREYTSHYITMNNDEIVDDVKKGIVALTRLDPSGDSFGAKLVRWAQERMESKAAQASSTNGTLGGRPPTNARCPKNKEEFKQFVADNNLHIGYAEEWLDIHKNRNWCFQSGEPIKNWKGALKEYCTKKEQEQQQPF